LINIDKSNWWLLFNGWQNSVCMALPIDTDFAHAVVEIVTSGHHTVFAIHMFAKRCDE
jgi:hypothetical protein